MPAPRLTTTIFVARSIARQGAHHRSYDYSRVSYTTGTAEVTIGCSVHGWFDQQARKHLEGSGCPRCAMDHTAQVKVAKASARFLARSKQAHGDTFDYSRVVYLGRHTQVEIGCPIHGFIWIIPKNHTLAKGCPKCSLERIGRSDMVRRFHAAHGDKFDYSHVCQRVKNATLVTIICPDHGAFIQRAKTHFRGHGCPKCAHLRAGFRQTSTPCAVYYVRLARPGFPMLWKIGTTKRATIQDRFQSEGRAVTVKVLWAKRFENGLDAVSVEQTIVDTFKAFRYDGPPILRNTKNTEIFTKNVLAAV